MKSKLQNIQCESNLLKKGSKTHMAGNRHRNRLPPAGWRWPGLSQKRGGHTSDEETAKSCWEEQSLVGGEAYLGCLTQTYGEMGYWVRDPTPPSGVSSQNSVRAHPRGWRGEVVEAT